MIFSFVGIDSRIRDDFEDDSLSFPEINENLIMSLEINTLDERIPTIRHNLHDEEMRIKSHEDSLLFSAARLDTASSVVELSLNQIPAT